MAGFSQSTMADRVAVSVQASQDQRNNSAKHPETVFLFVHYFECSPPVSLKNYARATLGKLSIYHLFVCDTLSRDGLRCNIIRLRLRFHLSF